MAATSQPLRRTTRLHPRVSQALLGGGLASLALLYWFPLRRWFRRWGTTPDERTRHAWRRCHHQSDAYRDESGHRRGAPGDIPWLVQMGSGGRGSTAMTGSIGFWLSRVGRVRIASITRVPAPRWGDRFPLEPRGTPITAVIHTGASEL